MGEFDWDGVTYPGIHEPLVSRVSWQRVQSLLDARAESKTRKVKHEFAYTGLVHCGHCGCLFVGELKKRRYVYYHCTGNRGKCPEPYTRQEVLDREFAEILQDLVIPQPVLAWLADAVVESDRSEQAARGQAVKRLRARYDQVKARIETMYLDKLDGRITQEFFDRQAAAWRADQDAIVRQIHVIQSAAPAPVEQSIDMMRLTSRAAELLLQQTAAEQRRLLQVVIKNASWQEGQLQTALFEPFEILRHSNQESSRKEKENGGLGGQLEIWLPKNYSFQPPLHLCFQSVAFSLKAVLSIPRIKAAATQRGPGSRRLCGQRSASGFSNDREVSTNKIARRARPSSEADQSSRCGPRVAAKNFKNSQIKLACVLPVHHSKPIDQFATQGANRNQRHRDSDLAVLDRGLCEETHRLYCLSRGGCAAPETKKPRRSSTWFRCR